MGDKGNEHALTLASVVGICTDLTGEEEHERVKELEIIFGAFEDIDLHALRRCSSLQKLTLINCRLRCIPTVALRAVRGSLVHLCLSAQNISRMEALDLPNLRALYLQQNRIERIEGLENCRRLKILWLYGNCIKRVENLSHCSDLRELCLQDNSLQSLSATDKDPSVEDLVNLETLHVARNRIRNIDELQALRKLVNLRNVSFSDEHFGTNPVVRHPEYRTVAIATLRQMQTLDGVTIDAAERTGAVDQFFTQAMAFNDTIAELTLQYEHDLRDIETRKLRGESNAKMLQRELIEALNEVEQSVVRGTQELEQEQLRHIRLREQHMALTVEAVEELRRQYQKQLDDMLASELTALDQEELYYEVLEQEAEASHSLALTVATLQCAFPTKIACETLPEHAPDYQHIVSQFENEERGDGTTHRVVQIIRFYHEDLVRTFDDAGGSLEHPGEGFTAYLYCAVDEDEAMAVLQHGFTKGQEQWIALFSDPVQALSFSKGRPGTFGDEDSESTANEHVKSRIDSHILLLCQVFVERVSEVTIGDAPLSQMGSLSSVMALVTAAASDSSNVGTFVHTQLRAGQTEGDLYITRRDSPVASVVPQFVVLCSQRLSEAPESPSQIHPTHSATLADKTHGPEFLLHKFSSEVDVELHRYHDRVWKELDPSAWVQKQQYRREIEQVDREATQVKHRVAEEKKLQRKMVKSARQRK